MPRIAALVEYDGTGYAGWQAQPHAPSIQQAVEDGLSAVAGQRVAVVCAGRTDAGVHARAQVIHFDTGSLRTARAWVLGTNTHLPPSIALFWAREIGTDFHARHEALRRTYRYYVLNRSERSPLDRERTAWIHRLLDSAALQDAAAALEGEHDFSAFRSIQCQSKSAVRTIHSIRVERHADLVFFEITATGFLHHMVRNIVGTLISLKAGAGAAQALAQILASGERRLAGPTAPAQGLYFWQADYAPHFGIPVKIASAPLLGL